MVTEYQSLKPTIHEATFVAGDTATLFWGKVGDDDRSSYYLDMREYRVLILKQHFQQLV